MKTGIESLISKYNIACPRYTSYPTVPYWNKEKPAIHDWKEKVRTTFQLTNNTKGISIYIHLPYCESLCTYCGCNTRITINHAVEKPYIAAVLKEWSMYLNEFSEKPKISELHLGGGTPTFFSPDNLKLLIEGIFEGCTILPNAEISFEGHPKNTSYDHLSTLRKLGFNRVSFGIQDFDDKVQDVINRYQSAEEVSKVTQMARELGYYSVNYDLVYGLPFQTVEGVKKTIEKVIELTPDRIAFYSYAHVPWLKPSQRKYTEKDLPDEQTKLAIHQLGRDLFLAAGYKDVGMDHYSLPADSLYKASKEGKLHRNFMGYTTNDTALMIGLGVSSISDSYTAFAQNVKVVEEYIDLINKGEIPVFKGHLLNEEDLLVRKHILNLICRHHTSWRYEKGDTEILDEALERLKELEADGFVEIGNQEIAVTQSGRQFVRNICLCFDARYWQAEPDKPLFSKAV